MSRIRPIKPSLPKSEKLYDLEQRAGLPIRFAVVGLVLYADREGRFEWRPRQIKSDVLPYDDCSMEDVLTALVGAGTLVRYQADGQEYGCFANWSEHQRPRGDERASVIPSPPQVSAARQALQRDDVATNPSLLSDEPVTTASRVRDGGVTNPHQGSGGPEKGSGGLEKGGTEDGARSARAREPVAQLRPAVRGRAVVNPQTCDELAMIAPSEAQLVMLHDKAGEAGVELQAVASELGVPVTGITVGRLKARLEDMILEQRRARASPAKTFAQQRDELTDQALADVLRRRAGCSTSEPENLVLLSATPRRSAGSN